MRDYHVVIPSDDVADRGKMRHLHDASFETLRMYFPLVVRAREMAAVWAQPRTA
jgi:hypothetical protein